MASPLSGRSGPIALFERRVRDAPVPYDRGMATVIARPIGRTRRFIGVLLPILLLLGTFALFDRVGQLQLEQSAAAKEKYWTNPISGKAAWLPQGWTLSIRTVEGAKDPVFSFAALDGSSVVRLAADSDVTGQEEITVYARQQRIALSTILQLDGDWAPFKVGNVEFVEANGFFLKRGPGQLFPEENRVPLLARHALFQANGPTTQPSPVATRAGVVPDHPLAGRPARRRGHTFFSASRSTRPSPLVKVSELEPDCCCETPEMPWSPLS
ncbi:hypothetical protein SAMN05216548_10930 [Faunimonas pinastri]|uniref:Uncharacterized protein n=1 Tax=Faunimonas pinastri TaxID=1855383 RepID=A0A1H9JZK0_9HYPH|nr:hypothetical protein SAMN05216548_10930 [Faunimonas pinastri]